MKMGISTDSTKVYIMNECFAINGAPAYKPVDKIGMDVQLNSTVPIAIDKLLMTMPMLWEIPEDSKGLRAFFGRK